MLATAPAALNLAALISVCAITVELVAAIRRTRYQPLHRRRRQPAPPIQVGFRYQVREPELQAELIGST